jgi:hypothetical protein
MAQAIRSVKGYGKEFRDKLINAGCVFRRHGRGDHDVWYSPIRNQNFIVPIWIMSRHTAVKVLRDAGLSEPFLNILNTLAT